MTLKNIDTCIMSVLFASPCNQIVFYKLYKCAIKDNIFLCAYYKELSYLEYTLLRHTFNSHNLFVNSYKLSNNYNTYYVLTFRIDKEMRKAAKELDFERAAELRDILIELRGD